MPSTTCISCGQLNMHGALLCASCGILLETTVRVRPSTNNLRNRNGDSHPNPSNQRTAHIGRLGAHSVAFYVQNDDEPVYVSFTKEMVIGRAMASDNETPRFDLSGYRAQEHGVSRRHAVLKRTPSGLTLEDMGSSNGTWVNGTLVLPYAPTAIQSGDQIRLGQFALEIYLP